MAWVVLHVPFVSGSSEFQLTGSRGRSVAKRGVKRGHDIVVTSLMVLTVEAVFRSWAAASCIKSGGVRSPLAFAFVPNMLFVACQPVNGLKQCDDSGAVSNTKSGRHDCYLVFRVVMLREWPRRKAPREPQLSHGARTQGRQARLVSSE